MSRVSLEDLKSHYGVEDSHLQLQCLDQHLEQIAHKVPNWLSIAMALGLEDYEQQAIKVDLNLDYLQKNMEVLKVWKRKNGRNATYLRLVRACLEISNAVLAGEVCQLAKTATGDSDPHSLKGWFTDIRLTQRDREILRREGFSTKQAFRFLTIPELNQLGLTRGGVRILEAHIQETKQQTESQVSCQPSSSGDCISQPNVEPSTEYLSTSSLRYVYKHTFEAHTKWFNIGLQLGLPKHTLDGITRNRSLHDDTDYYREMLTSWLHTGQAKMADLLETLEGPTVGMEDVARHINSLSDEEKKQLGME